MKKNLFAVVLVFALLIGLRAQGPPPQQQMKLEDVQKALCLVDKTQPAPEKYKAGLEAITAKETLAMLSYVSSDLLEGRDTASRGFDLAAEYAASLLKMWGVKPAGDMPAAMGGFRMGGARGQAPQAPRERSYFQEFAMKEVSDSETVITIEAARGGMVKTRSFKAGLDFGAGSGASAAAPRARSPRPSSSSATASPSRPPASTSSRASTSRARSSSCSATRRAGTTPSRRSRGPRSSRTSTSRPRPRATRCS